MNILNGVMILDGSTLRTAGEVLAIFVIPFGGGIPAGIVLANERHLPWTFILILYFISDVLLACAFEPLMHWFIRASKTSPLLSRWAESYKSFLAKTGFKYGLNPGPFSLIVLSFGVDPMTGRAVAKSVGHGFFSGWAIAIGGDMIFFALIMASTLWLNNILGDGTLTAIIIMVAMMIVPMAIKKFRRD